MAQASTDPFAAYAEPPHAGAAHDHPISGDPFGAYAEAKTAQPPPGPALLGDSTKPASLHAPTWRERLNDVVSPETQRMIGGGVGALAATALAPEAAGAGLLLRGVQALVPVAGAAVGGATTAVAQGAPAKDIIPAGTEQGALEAGGQAIAWPLRAIGRRLLAHPVAKAAASALESGRSMVNEQLDTILATADAAVRGTRQGARAAEGRAKEAARGAKAAVGLAEEKAAQGTAEAAGKWPTVTPPPGAPPMAVSHAGPPVYAQTGRQVAGVIQGPAKHSLDQLGQAVGEAASTGPAVDFRPIKAKLEAMASAARPSTIAGKATAGQEYVHAAGGSDTLTQAFKDAGIAMEESHPLPGVLSQIQNAPDTVSFADAHKYKRLLDDATNWQSPARKQLHGITKGIRSTLREALAVHPPYNEATDAYQQAVPLFTKGVAKQITRSAADNPEAIAKLVKPDQPTRLQMLHDVLMHHAAEGGGAEEGRQAWNGVRSALTWEHLIKPGIEKFEASLAKFHPDVVALAYGDTEGKAVLDHLQQISAAFQQAQEGGRATRTAAKTAAVHAADTAARTAEAGRSAIAQRSTEAGATRAQVAVAKKPTPTETAFATSSLASTPPPAQIASEVLHAGASHGMGVFKARAVGKLLFSGPKVNDLVQWAAYSRPRTQLLVRAVTGPAPGMMIADLMREAGIIQAQADLPQMAVSHDPSGPPR